MQRSDMVTIINGLCDELDQRFSPLSAGDYGHELRRRVREMVRERRGVERYLRGLVRREMSKEAKGAG